MKLGGQEIARFCISYKILIMHHLLSRPVSEIMSKDVTMIHKNSLMTEVAKLFETHGFSHLPVVNKDCEFIGMVSKSDYYKLLHHFTILETGS